MIKSYYFGVMHVNIKTNLLLKNVIKIKIENWYSAIIIKKKNRTHHKPL